ncbi:unnamed protein product [Caenorhabditis sp. 36 PRJEB53466]|nr:unnamed protein product [Caenorhabditis sp. 36 PRJEB53466]
MNPDVNSSRVNVSLKTEMMKYTTGVQLARPSSSSDPLLFWKTHKNEYPILSSISKNLLAVPSSSAATQRLFSSATYLTNNEKRNRMKADTLDAAILQVMSNSNLLNANSKMFTQNGEGIDDEEDLEIERTVDTISRTSQIHRASQTRKDETAEYGIEYLITGFSTPPTPVHAATFIKRWKTTDQSAQFGFTYTSVAQAGTPTKGMVGEFQCATYQDALNFRCGFDEHLCSCIAQGTVLRCPCRHFHLDAVLKKTLLPRGEAGIAILTEGELINTKLTTSSLVSIQLQFRNQSIHRIVKDDNCSIATTTITGCFSCGKGALLTATCTSMVHKRIEATVKCPTIGVDFLECGINGVRGKINFHSTQRKIEETCSISCGTVKQEFSLQGELAEEATFDASGLRDRFAEFTQKIGEGGIFDVITGKIAAVWSTITSWIGSGIVIMVVLVIGGMKATNEQIASNLIAGSSTDNGNGPSCKSSRICKVFDQHVRDLSEIERYESEAAVVSFIGTLSKRHRPRADLGLNSLSDSFYDTPASFPSISSFPNNY